VIYARRGSKVRISKINLSTFFVRESNMSKNDRRKASIKTKNSIKGSKVQSVAECDGSLNLHSNLTAKYSE
jgi:hypothetical protein